MPSLGHSAAAPLTARLFLLAALGVSAVLGATDAGTAARAAGGGWRRGYCCGQHREFCAVMGGAARRRWQPAGPARGRLYRRSDGRRGWCNARGDPVGPATNRQSTVWTGRLETFRMPERAVTGRARLPCPPTWVAFATPSRRRSAGPAAGSGHRRGAAGGAGRTASRLEEERAVKPAPVTPGQERLILTAFEAGLKPAVIAREFRLSRAQVDGVVAAANQRRR